MNLSIAVDSGRFVFRVIPLCSEGVRDCCACLDFYEMSYDPGVVRDPEGVRECCAHMFFKTPVQSRCRAAAAAAASAAAGCS